MLKKLVALAMIVMLVVGCASPATPSPTQAPAVQATLPEPTDAPTATQVPPSPTPLPPTATPIPPTPTPVALRVWIDGETPAYIHEQVSAALAGQYVEMVEDANTADLRIGPEITMPLAEWYYAVVVPFPSLVEQITWEEIARYWQGETDALAALASDNETPVLFVTEPTLRDLTHLLGEPSADTPIQIVASDSIVNATWEERLHAWGIVPFDMLEPKWKVLPVDGVDLLDKNASMADYPLALRAGAEGLSADTLLALLAGDRPLATNRDTERMTVLIMTGVTALVRATAHEMEVNGVLYPAAYISETLRSADITHISNEIPFAKNCPPPDRESDSLVFCSSPAYIELLRFVGADVIELTGNHFQDYGSQATLDTLQMYRDEGWPYYGGGADLEDARKPLIMESNGNSLSFIGCNPVGPEFAWATADSPGAAPCDFVYMHEEISRLRNEVDVPIVTWQYWEHYIYEATPDQEVDFRGMVDAGAEIVSGSQAHHPQAIEFYEDGFIHYGLGNLFFDQMWSVGTRQQMVDRHIIYNGKHISTQLLTYMLENFAQPRPMTEQERAELLMAVFEASGW